MEKYRPKPDDFELIGRSDDPLVEQYQPKFLGMGGDQIVYEIPDHPGVVVKVGYEFLKQEIEDNLRRGRPADTLTEKERDWFENKMRPNREEAMRLLGDYFGAEHLVPERMYLMKVPVTPEVLHGIFNGEVPEGAQGLEAAWTRVVIQKKVPELQGERLTFSPGGRPEQKKRVVDPQEYKRGTDILLKGLPGEFTGEDFLQLLDNKNEQPLRALWTAMEKEPQLKALVTDFVARSIKFANETGRIFDMGGTDNIIFFKEESGSWNYKFVDAILGSRKPLDLARNVLRDLVAGRPMPADEKEKVWALHKMVNFARIFNGFAAFLGVSDRVEIFDERDKDKEIDLLGILQKYPKP